MTTLYKLTTQDAKTCPGRRNECVWGEGVTHRGTGEGELCEALNGVTYTLDSSNLVIADAVGPVRALRRTVSPRRRCASCCRRAGSLRLRTSARSSITRSRTARCSARSTMRACAA